MLGGNETSRDALSSSLADLQGGGGGWGLAIVRRGSVGGGRDLIDTSEIESKRLSIKKDDRLTSLRR